MALMRLCEIKGRFLFEADPVLFPGGRLGAGEIAAWSAYYEMEAERYDKVKRKNLK